MFVFYSAMRAAKKKPSRPTEDPMGWSIASAAFDEVGEAEDPDPVLDPVTETVVDPTVVVMVEPPDVMVETMALTTALTLAALVPLVPLMPLP